MLWVKVFRSCVNWAVAGREWRVKRIVADLTLDRQILQVITLRKPLDEKRGIEVLIYDK